LREIEIALGAATGEHGEDTKYGNDSPQQVLGTAMAEHGRISANKQLIIPAL